MKIAFVFDQFLFGGIERVGINHIKLLKELGHSVDAYILDPRTEGLLDELKKECNVKIVPFSRSSCPENYWAITRRFKIGKFTFPLVYLAVDLGKNLQKLLKKQRTKYDLAVAFSGHFNDLTFVADNFIKADKKACWLHGALYQYVMTHQGFENLYKKIHNLTVLVDDAQTEVLTYHAKDHFNFNIKKIYNPICIEDKEIDKTKVKELKQKYGSFFLMAARMNYPHKDHYTVLKAVKILRDKYKQNVKLVLLGDGPERKKIEKFVKDENISDMVVFENSQPDVQNYYKACSVLVHASVAGEGLPTIIIEALGMKKPVVCTDSKVGPREILGDSQYGLLTKVQDPEDMANKLNLILTDDILYKSCVREGSKRYKDFSPSVIKKELASWLEGLE